ncbi:hypothetical protein SmJEL517_g00002 [Synchytrium microbalum]|uniref:Methyltransferase FkbM domain-containing protein n=1 Tax=Synchytrium microbalum TaxID=1806994 RepID=A0A507CEU8_9FUNG|nr:uncharacterized protein SmJEL517_g00002 [Synchytrium microbalum]TPX38011.1 hypothetical protein SmJEL517_g00002 [Synchytrium microbalum]
MYVHYLHLQREEKHEELLEDLRSRRGVLHDSSKRCVFVDLGAGRADTLRVFLRERDAKFSYDYPIPYWAHYTTCEIYLFEANPRFTADLRRAESLYRSRGFNVTVFPEHACTDYDGIATLYLDEKNKDNDYWLTSCHNKATSLYSQGRPINVTAIDIASWLAASFKPEDYVLVKMDIEKAEFFVLPRMVEVHADTVVDTLMVELHPYDFADEQIAKGWKAIEELSKTILIPYYDSFA